MRARLALVGADRQGLEEAGLVEEMARRTLGRTAHEEKTLGSERWGVVVAQIFKSGQLNVYTHVCAKVSAEPAGLVLCQPLDVDLAHDLPGQLLRGSPELEVLHFVLAPDLVSPDGFDGLTEVHDAGLSLGLVGDLPGGFGALADGGLQRRRLGFARLLLLLRPRFATAEATEGLFECVAEGEGRKEKARLGAGQHAIKVYV